MKPKRPLKNVDFWHFFDVRLGFTADETQTDIVKTLKNNEKTYLICINSRWLIIPNAFTDHIWGNFNSTSPFVHSPCICVFPFHIFNDSLKCCILVNVDSFYQWTQVQASIFGLQSLIVSHFESLSLDVFSFRNMLFANLYF